MKITGLGGQKVPVGKLLVAGGVPVIGPILQAKMLEGGGSHEQRMAKFSAALRESVQEFEDGFNKITGATNQLADLEKSISRRVRNIQASAGQVSNPKIQSILQDIQVLQDDINGIYAPVKNLSEQLTSLNETYQSGAKQISPHKSSPAQEAIIQGIELIRNTKSAQFEIISRRMQNFDRALSSLTNFVDELSYQQKVAAVIGQSRKDLSDLMSGSTPSASTTAASSLLVPLLIGLTGVLLLRR
jgi:methyl-accepting chemotaxis protein